MQAELAEQQRLQAEQNAAKQTPSGNTSGNTSGNNSPWYSETKGTGTGQDIVNYAKNFLGVNYVYGGTSPSGFDCSGLVILLLQALRILGKPHRGEPRILRHRGFLV